MNKKERQQLGLSFLQVAQVDLITSNLLYQSSIYHNAIFSLQQAIEKSLKGVGLCVGFINPNQLRGVNHFATDVYKKGLEQLLKDNRALLNQISLSEDLMDSLNYQNEEIQGQIDFIKKLKDVGIDSDLSLEVLDDHIKMIWGEPPTDTYNVKKMSEDVASRTFTLIEREEIKDRFANKIAFTEREEKNTKQIVQGIYETSIRLEIVIKSLTLLDILFYSHENSSRYPCEECGGNPIDFYDSKNPLIIRFNELFKCVELALGVVVEIIK